MSPTLSSANHPSAAVAAAAVAASAAALETMTRQKSADVTKTTLE